MVSVKTTLISAGLAVLPALDASAEAFLEESRTSIRYSQYYWNADPDDGFGPTRDEWVHGGELTFRSGYAAGLFGLDASFAVANDLHIGSEADNVTNLRADSSVQDPHGIAGMNELYGRLQLLDAEHQRLTAGYGKRPRDRAQYADNRTRLQPSATLGLDIDYRWQGLSLYFTQIEGFSARDSSQFAEPLATFGGEDVDYLRVVGGSVDILPDTTLLLEHAEAKDYIASTLGELTHAFTLGGQRRVELTLRHGQQRDAGSLYEKEGAGPYPADQHHEARFYDLGAKYHAGAYYLGANVNTVTGDDYDRLFFAEDHGSWKSSANNFYWFGLEDETMIKLSAGMSFAEFGLPGLRLDAHYAFSNDAAGFDDFSRTELQSVLSYRFSGFLDGLNLAWLHAEHETEGTPDGEARTALKFSPAGIITHHADRFYLTYTHTF